MMPRPLTRPMSLLRRILTLVLAGLLFQSSLAAATMRPMTHAEVTHPGATSAGAAQDGVAHHAGAHHEMGMPSEDGTDSPAHECDGTPVDCAAMSACSTPAIAAMPSPVAAAVAPAGSAAAASTESPTSRSLTPDVPPPRG